MAEHHDERRRIDPIVPDAASSLTAPRQRQRQPGSVRLWPLWLLLLAMLGTLAGAGYLAWEERQRLQADIGRLQGELSNVHARFDASGDSESDTEEHIDALEARQAALEARDEARLGRLRALEQALEASRAVPSERVDDLSARLARLEEAAETRDALLDASQRSLDALERTGAEGRAALASTLEGVEIALAALVTHDAEARAESAAMGERLQALHAEQRSLSERLDVQEAQLQRALDEQADTFQEEVAELANALAALSAEVDPSDAQARAARLTALELELGELRRTQLALSARLEALRP